MGLSAKHLIAASAAAFIGIGAAAACLDHALRNALEQAFPAMLLTRQPTDVLAIGDSTVAAGFNVPSFVSEWRPSGSTSPQQALNAGLGGTGLTQWHVAWRLASENKADITHLIVGTFDHRLTNPSLIRWSSWFGLDAMAFHADPSWSARYACTSAFDQLCYRTARHFPLFTERGNMWAKVEMARRFLGSLGLDREAMDHQRMVRDIVAVLEPDREVFLARTREAVTGHSPLAPQIADTLTAARKKGIETTVVMMPMPADRHGLYITPEWRDYMKHLRGLVEPLGARLIDATTWITEQGAFVDQLHLSDSGAASFSRRLAREMAAR